MPTKKVGKATQDMSGSKYAGPKLGQIKTGKDSGRTQTSSVSVSSMLKTGTKGGRGQSMKGPSGNTTKYEHTKQKGNLGLGKA